ncbi:adhesin/invasin [Marinobacter daqiaonensis]|uniref:Adhesin/invasin n=1 Tax=Marinobacter daqiaonensis TaxID=650891 RepID=A0A1I6K3K2_9GAMM|nr:Ig-like domain-containing protein [Marinobacter daqiaonensis]SFR85744.1 adhesin/invasin [Marinobacter daqiaonensis]
MSGKFLARALAMSLALFLVACGGGDGSTPLSGQQGDGGSTGGGDEEVQVGTVDLLASPTQTGTSSASESELTVVVKDSNGVLLEGVSVDFSVDSNASLRIDQAVTDAAGLAFARVTPGDARNRSALVSVTAGGVTDEVSISFSGTGISIAGPSSVSFGDTAQYRISLTDSEGNGIPDQIISVSSSLGNLQSGDVQTGTNGVIEVALSASSRAGTEIVTASAYSGQSEVSASKEVTIAADSFTLLEPVNGPEINLNTPTEITLEWLVENQAVADGTPVSFSTTRGILDPADGNASTSGGTASILVSSTNAGPATITARDPSSGLETDLQVEFVATIPDDLTLQAEQTQLDLGEPTEIVATVRDANNNLVKNQEVTFNIIEDGSGGSLSRSTAITDSSGKAKTTYNAGNAGSGRNGVEIRASVAGTIEDTLFLTVARQALRLAIGTGNTIFEPDDARYRKPFVAIVTDSNGAPVENAIVELSVLPTGYRKGQWIVVNEDYWAISPSQPIFCATEDTNGNGVLDQGEDRNSNNELEPTNSATTSSPTVTTSSDGSAGFDLIYPQSHCAWIGVELTGTIEVDGTESVESSTFFLSCSADDLSDPDIEPPGGTEGLLGSQQTCANLE